MDEEEPLNGERLEITLNISQASSLYVITTNSLKYYTKLLEELKKELQKDNSEELRLNIELYKAIIRDTEFLRKEAGEIVMELDNKPESKIIKPKWSQSN